jgi:DNA-binding transcriptional MocR family regulator
MTIPTTHSLQKAHRRQNHQAEAKRQRQERARRVLEKMMNGAVLYRRHQHGRIIWCLVWKGGSEFLTRELVTDALASGNIVGVGDALPFAGAELSQTFRYIDE